MKPARSLLAQPEMWPTFAIFLACLLATVAAWRYQSGLAEARIEESFGQVSQEIADDLNESMADHARALRAVAAAFRIAKNVTHRDWRDFVSKLDAGRDYPGTVATGLAVAVYTASERLQLERAAQSEGFNGFAVWPPGESAVAMPVRFIEPSDPMLQTGLGFDLYSEPIRRRAIELARDTGEPVLSGVLPPLQNAQSVNVTAPGSVILCVPLLNQDGLAGVPGDHTLALDGVAFFAFRIEDFIKGVLARRVAHAAGRAGLEIFAGKEIGSDAAIYGAAVQPPGGREGIRTKVVPIELYGQNWTLRFTSTPAFEAAARPNSPMVVLIAGLLLTALLSASAWNINRRELEALDGERRIRESEQKLSGILKIAADAIISIDGNSSITMFNEGAESIFGYRKEEAIGRSLDMLLPDRYVQSHARHIAAFSSSPVAARTMGERREIFGRRKSGEEFPAEASISRLGSNEGRIFTVVLRDITERKRSQEALATTAARLSVALKAGRAGMFHWDVTTGKLFWSPETELVFGLPVASFEGTIEGWEKRVIPEDLPRLKAELNQALAERMPLLLQEYRIVRPDGSCAWLSSRSELTYDDGGKLTGVIGINVDITERKQAEDVLEVKVAERTRALQNEIRRREEVQAVLVQTQRMEALGQLTGGIAHDSNNLLTVIAGNLEMIEDDLDGHAAMKYLREAQEAAAMSARLNQRLLTFSRKRKLEPQVININDQVLGMSELLRRTLGEAINVTTLLAHDIWLTRVDPSEIENAILNMAINARDAMQEGGDLRIETSNSVIDPDFAAREDGLVAGDFVRLSVSDTGAGMPPEVLRRAFEPFFTTKSPGQGTGLGLSTLYGFVKQSGGQVNIYSEVGHGTTINIYLPRNQGSGQAASKPEHGVSIPKARGEKILVVEDNEQVRQLTVERLKRLGYQVASADGAPGAVALLEDGNAFDLVLSDVVMPGGMSGFDLARLVRQRWPSLRVVLASGFSEDAIRGADQDIKNIRVLRKPYSIAELAQYVRETLDG